MSIESHLPALEAGLRRGHELCSGRCDAKAIHSDYDAWLEDIRQKLERLPNEAGDKARFRVEWLGLPSPFFTTLNHAAVYDRVDVQRAIEQRCAWLSRTIISLMSPQNNAGGIVTVAGSGDSDATSVRLPRLFIGSSAEGLPLAKAIESILFRDAEVTLWSSGIFGLSEGTLEALVTRLSQFDFAALVLTPDDLTESRATLRQAPRDNVLFELGLFMGRLGRNRTFIVYNEDEQPKLPTDLAGVTAATFKNRTDGNKQAQVSPACTQIGVVMARLGKLQPGAVA